MLPWIPIVMRLVLLPYFAPKKTVVELSTPLQFPRVARFLYRPLSSGPRASMNRAPRTASANLFRASTRT